MKNKISQAHAWMNRRLSQLTPVQCYLVGAADVVITGGIVAIVSWCVQ